MTRDWQQWHRAYDDDNPDHPLRRRLVIVQGRIAEALDRAPDGPIRAISLCAGEGRDLLGVLARHPRAGDVRGRLVELDPDLAATARAAAPPGIEVVNADASSTGTYAGAVPADLVLVCGIFGNIVDADIERTIATLSSLCAPGATVIWTRHRRPPDRTVLIRDRLEASHFEQIAFDAPDNFLFAVGTHRYAGPPQPFDPSVKMFEFVGYDDLWKTMPDRCDECAYEYERDERDQLATVIRRDAAAWAERIAGAGDDELRRRPAPDVWSPLEYACHVRDVLRVQRQRVDLALTTETPEFAPMRRDERAIEERYNQQPATDVVRDLTQAAEDFAGKLESLDDAAWQRTGIYNYPTKQVRTIEWIARHTVHELEHHVRDIELH